MAKEWIHRKKIAATPLLLVLVLTLLYGLSQAIFLECRFGFAHCQPFNMSHIVPLSPQEPIDENDQLVLTGKPEGLQNSRQRLAERYNGRLTWVFFIAVSVLLCVGVLAVLSIQVYTSSRIRNENAALRVSSVLVLSFLLGIILWLSPNSFMPIMREILENTIAKGKGGMPIVFEVTRFLNALGYTATFMLIFASCSILLPCDDVVRLDLDNGNIPKEPPTDEESKYKKKLSIRLTPITDQMKKLRVILYAGTLLLIMGIFRMSVVAQWSLSFISQDATEVAKGFYTTLFTVTGGFYTLILAAIYLPALFILQKRAQRIARELCLMPDQRQEILKSAGFKFSFREALPRVLAIIGPFLAGPVGELFESLAINP